jgi:hypothetical protein
LVERILKSFQQLKGKQEFKDGHFENVFLVTNKSMDLGSFRRSGLELTTDVEVEFLKGSFIQFNQSCVTQLTGDFGISHRSIKEFGIFLEKLIICFDGPSEPEIKSELEEKLGVHLSKIFYEIKNFSLESCPEKWIQKRKLFGKQNIIFQGKQSLLLLAEVVRLLNSVQ